MRESLGLGVDDECGVKMFGPISVVIKLRGLTFNGLVKSNTIR